jgi:hypothetical protein
MSALDRYKDTARGVIEDTINQKEWLPKDSLIFKKLLIMLS